MRKIVLITIVMIAAWQLEKQSGSPRAAFDNYSSFNESTSVSPVTAFACDGREHCSQMTSREEARYFVSNCPNTKMDGDYDGEPCENDSRF